ncbi:MAG: hypothetical protein AAFY71_13545 [Bacteroidota bacterium]
MNIRIPILSLLLLAITVVACDQETYEQPIPDKRYFYRFINLNPNLDPVDVRVRTIDDVKWLAYDVKFEKAEPTDGFSSVLIPLDTLERDTSEFVFIDIIDHRTKESVVPPLELGTIGDRKADFPTTIMLIDSFGKPFRVARIEDYETPTNGTAGIRFVNVNSQYISVSLVVKNDTTSIDQYNFLTYSPFEYVKAGTRTIYYKNDITGAVIDSISNINLSAGRIYSFYMGQKGTSTVVGYEKLF